jgi:capsule polysaccharide export protein KpsE/RkpR
MIARCRSDSVTDRGEKLMGFAASQARYLTLTARKSDLELQGQFINQARLQLANVTGSLFTISSNLEPESPEAQQIQARVAAIQAIDKSLELQLRRVDTQREAVQTEIDAVRKVIGKNIESTFKTFG